MCIKNCEATYRKAVKDMVLNILKYVETCRKTFLCRMWYQEYLNSLVHTKCNTYSITIKRTMFSMQVTEMYIFNNFRNVAIFIQNTVSIIKYYCALESRKFIKRIWSKLGGLKVSLIMRNRHWSRKKYRRFYFTTKYGFYENDQHSTNSNM